MRKNKKTKIVILIFGILLIGIGYAYLTANLKITGTANISNAKWDVHFENAKSRDVADTVTFPSNSNSNVEEGEPVIVGEAKQEIEWTAIFNAPGDYYSFDANVVNDGDIDAQLDYKNSFVTLQVGNDDELSVSFDKLYDYYYYEFDNPVYDEYEDEHVDIRPEGMPEYLNYKINYDGLDLPAGDQTGYIFCQLEIDKDKITNEEWANLQGKEIKMKVTLKYEQSDGSNDWVPYIIFENPVVNQNGTNTSVVPSITNKKLTYGGDHDISFDVVFNNPGDYYEFTVDVTNYARWGGFVYLDERSITIGDGEKIDLGVYGQLTLPEGIVYNNNGYTHEFPVCQLDTRKVTIRIGLDPNISTERLNELKGKHIKMEYNFGSDSGRDSASIGRCPAYHHWY